MVWTAPITFVSGTTLTAAQLNTNLRDNLNETMPAKATTAGYHFVSTGTGAIAERAIEAATVNAFESGTSATYANLATPGPMVTVTTGTKALCVYSVNARHSLDHIATLTSIAVSGATSVAANDAWAIIVDGLSPLQALACGMSKVFGLTPGSNTFIMQHRTNSGTGTYGNRHLIVIAL